MNFSDAIGWLLLSLVRAAHITVAPRMGDKDMTRSVVSIAESHRSSRFLLLPGLTRFRLALVSTRKSINHVIRLSHGVA